LIAVVDGVLDEIGAGGVPQLLVFNKIDVWDANVPVGEHLQANGIRTDFPVGENPDAAIRGHTSRKALPRIDHGEGGLPTRVWVSAATGRGLDLLREAVGVRLAGARVRADLQLPPEAGRLRSRLIELGAVASERYDEHGWTLAIDAPRDVLAPLAGELRADDGRLLRAWLDAA
jgi:GTPase